MAMKYLGALNTFTLPTAYLSAQEVLLHLKAISHSTPGQQFRCIPQARAHVCRRTLIIQEGLGRALHVTKIRM